MSQSNIPNITPTITVTREDAINLLLASVAIEKLGLGHIINAEAEKIQFYIGTLPGITATVTTVSDLLALDQSVQNTLVATLQSEMLLSSKLETVMNISASTGATRAARATEVTGTIEPAVTSNNATVYTNPIISVPPNAPITFQNHGTINGTAISFAPRDTKITLAANQQYYVYYKAESPNLRSPTYNTVNTVLYLNDVELPESFSAVGNVNFTVIQAPNTGSAIVNTSGAAGKLELRNVSEMTAEFANVNVTIVKLA